ncbi:MAG: hypothetical protein MUF48_13910 [Pirellulaceae bacterium]|nr:hypothetical protein [Pirellulaceae bacterium]
MLCRRTLTGTIAATLMFASLGSAQDSDADADKTPGLNASLLSGLSFRGLGPAFMSGRISDIAVDSVDRNVWYVAAASGGVWKTENCGTTWTPIFDGYGSYSIGCVTVDPQNRHVVWVGTGENNSQRSVGYGDGVYKSLDGGKSFTRVGLENSEHIGKILIDPRDSQVVYVAAQGPLWAPGGDRGLYKTTDGGQTWTLVLNISENTGVSDVVFDPRNPDVLLAVAYQRRRHVWTLINGGPESALYKSTDGGQNWRKITRGLPGVDLGRIGVAVSPIQPDVVYALVEAAEGQSGFFKSTDGGETWAKQGSYESTSPQYYQEIVACPHVFDRVYSLDTYMMVSQDGGKSFQPLGEQWKHVDNHALVIDPHNANHLLIGCDGGLYETWDRGQNYDFKANLPLTQFYKIAVDNDLPFYNIYGGTQDNATQGGPTRTRHVSGIRNSDWFITVFGDGFDPAVDPTDPNIVYSQWQYGGLIRYDRRTGEQIDIKPQEEPDGPPLRWNWDSPLLISPHAAQRIYYGAQILFRSDDRGDTWRAISPDLSRNLDRNALKVMGRVWGVDAVAKNNSTSFYGSIMSISESPLVDGLLYVGTDDGLVQISEDGGQNWRKVEDFPGLDVPEFAFVNDVEASRHDPNTVYVVMYNYKRGDFRPYVVKSTDRGHTWSSIAGDLPPRGSTYTIVQDHVKPEMLFVGTEFGVFVTLDGGLKWIPLRGGLPTIVVRDLEIQRRENDLAVGTFGRGFYILDDYAPLRELTTELLDRDAHLFAIKPAQLFIQTDPSGGGEKGFQGASFYTAPNPPFGATFTYFLKESLRTKKEQRQEKDRQLAQKNQDVAYPSWEELKAEDREEAPAVLLIIRDAAGEVVRRMTVPASQGLHRVTWDFRYSGYTPVQLGDSGFGPLAIPGQYTVSFAKRVDGQLTELIPPTPFTVEALGTPSLPAPNRSEVLAFQKQTGELQRAVYGAYRVAQETADQLKHMKQAVEQTPGVDPALGVEVRNLELRLTDILERFSGDPTKPRRNEPGMPGILSRVQTVVYGHWSTTSGPTQSHRRSYDIAAQQYSAVLGDLQKLVEQDVPELGRKLEAAGAPWTPGRGIPQWRRG